MSGPMGTFSSAASSGALRRRHLSRCIPATAGLALLVSSCGGSSESFSPPVHNPESAFTVACTDKTCTFTDGSFDPDGTIVTRGWDFGDGSTSAEVNPAHTYVGIGIYGASLKVVDDSGATASSSRAVVVGDAGPLFIGAGDIADCSSGSAKTATVIDQYPG